MYSKEERPNTKAPVVATIQLKDSCTSLSIIYPHQTDTHGKHTLQSPCPQVYRTMLWFIWWIRHGKTIFYRKRKYFLRQQNNDDYIILGDLDEETFDSSSYASCKSRRKKQRLMKFIDDEGNIVSITPKSTSWYFTYILNPQLESPLFHARFHRRFCLPYNSYIELLQQVKEHELFKTWHDDSHDAIHEPASPITLLLLGSLR